MAELTINGIKFNINPNDYYGNCINTKIVPLETKQESNDKPDIEYLQEMVNNNKDWNKIINIIDVDFNNAEITDIENNTISLKTISDLLNIIQQQNNEINKLKKDMDLLVSYSMAYNWGPNTPNTDFYENQTVYVN